MFRSRRSFLAVWPAVLLTLAGIVPAWGQSGTRTPPATKPADRSAAETPLALEGHSAVRLRDGRQWVKGSSHHETVYDGHRYRFQDDAEKQVFLADAAKYVPVLGGDCVVGLVKMDRRIPGKIRHGSHHDGRLFLFANAGAKRLFEANPAEYANADLALGGFCAVCRVDGGVDVPGNPDIVAHYHGFRYLFPGEAQRETFLANPELFAVAPHGPPPVVQPRGSGTR